MKEFSVTRGSLAKGEISQLETVLNERRRVRPIRIHQARKRQAKRWRGKETERAHGDVYRRIQIILVLNESFDAYSLLTCCPSREARQFLNRSCEQAYGVHARLNYLQKTLADLSIRVVSNDRSIATAERTVRAVLVLRM